MTAQLSDIERYRITEEENKKPVNQTAKRFLQMAKVSVAIEYLNILQLVEWVLRNGKAEIRRAGNDRVNQILLATVEAMMWEDNPRSTMHLLLENGPTEGDPESVWIDLKELAEQRTPEEAAWLPGGRSIQEALIYIQP